MINLAIVTVHFHKPEDTLALLDSIRSADLSPQINLRVYVVDNGGGNKLDLQPYPFATLVGGGQNLGFTGGNNLGLKIALQHGADWLLLLNNDTLLAEDFFDSIVSSIKTHPDVGAIGGLIYFASGYEFHKRYTAKQLGRVIWFAGGLFDSANVLGSHRGVDDVDQGQYRQVEPTDFITGACFLTRADVLNQVGLFDDRYFMYLEDLDLCLRIKKAGYSLLFDPSLKLHHKVASSSGIGSSLNDYFITRNRLLLGFTHLSLRTKFALFREAIHKLISGPHSSRLAVLDFFTAKLGKGSFLKS